MQIITKEIALDQKNGLGRSEPNQFPYLPPPEGRVEFSILNPGQMLTDIVGQRQYKKCCTDFVKHLHVSSFSLAFFSL